MARQWLYIAIQELRTWAPRHARPFNALYKPLNQRSPTRNFTTFPFLAQVGIAIALPELRGCWLVCCCTLKPSFALETLSQHSKHP